MMQAGIHRAVRAAAGSLVLLLACGCSVLMPKATPTSFHTLDVADAAIATTAPIAASAPTEGPTLIVNPTHAAAGFDSSHIIYVRAPHRLEYFAHSEWVDTPARMLAPLIVAAIERRGGFGAVVLTPSASAGDLVIETQIVRLQQDFGQQPSSVRFTLRADLVDAATRRVLGSREFDVSVPSASDDPRGGVEAASRAVQDALDQLAVFCSDTVTRWHAAAAALR
jgi:cholesterol transport system auxiliary component